MMKAFVLGVFMVIGLAVNAQTNAKSYFNSGAKDYVHSNLEKAIATVDQGLKKFPQDENLNQLKEKLIEEKKKEDQKKDQQKKDDQKKKDDQNKDDQKNKDKDKDKEKNEEDKKDEDKDKENENKEEENKSEEDKNKEEEKKQQQQQPQVGKMTPQQIKQLLETMNNEEAKTQKKVNAQKVKGKKVQQEKDW